MDDLPDAMVTFPFLTVAAQPAFEMGRESVAMLLDRSWRTPGRAPREVVLPTKLVIRRSSGDAIGMRTTSPGPTPTPERPSAED